MVKPSKTKPAKLQLVEEATLLRVCGLCGEAAKPLTRTECCENLICDDEDEYVMFSYAGTAATGTTIIRLCAPFIIVKSTLATGRTARSAARSSNPKCMPGTQRTRTTSRN